MDDGPMGAAAAAGCCCWRGCAAGVLRMCVADVLQWLSIIIIIIIIFIIIAITAIIILSLVRQWRVGDECDLCSGDSRGVKDKTTDPTLYPPDPSSNL